MKTKYEILIRFDNDGAYKGAHIVHRDNVTGQIDPPQSIRDEDWPDLVKAIDTATLASAEANLAAIAERDAATAALTEKDTTISEKEQAILDREAVIAQHVAEKEALAAELAVAKLPPKEQRQAELNAKLAALAAEATKVQAEKDALE